MSTAMGDAGTVLRRALRPSRVVLAVRMVLLVVLLLIGVHSLRTTDDRPVGDLLQGLAGGTVSSVRVAAPGRGLLHENRSPVLWTDGARHPHLALYDRVEGAPDPVLEAARTSPRPPDVTLVSRGQVDPRFATGTTWSRGTVVLPLLALLLLGPEPRRGTRWAWFWATSALPLAWLAYLVLEPALLWQVRPAPPRHRRVTAGWALLGALLVSALLADLLPTDLRTAVAVR